jgi:hypothetical protein
VPAWEQGKIEHDHPDAEHTTLFRGYTYPYLPRWDSSTSPQDSQACAVPFAGFREESKYDMLL